MIRQGEKFIIMKYSDSVYANSMEEHINVIRDYGFCWYGKIGKKLSETVVDTILSNEQQHMFFYKKGALYLAKVETVSFEKKLENIPLYYKEILYPQMNFPSTYLKLIEIKPISLNVLECLETSTGKKVSEAIVRCMNPVMFSVCVKDFNEEGKV